MPKVSASAPACEHPERYVVGVVDVCMGCGVVRDHVRQVQRRGRVPRDYDDARALLHAAAGGMA